MARLDCQSRTPRLGDAMQCERMVVIVHGIRREVVEVKNKKAAHCDSN